MPGRNGIGPKIRLGIVAAVLFSLTPTFPRTRPVLPLQSECVERTVVPSQRVVPLSSKAEARAATPGLALRSPDREPGTIAATKCCTRGQHLPPGEAAMNGIIYLVGLVVIVLFILSAIGLR